MKTRKVVITLEVETDAKVDELKHLDNWGCYVNCLYFCITEKPKVTVVQAVKKGGKK